MKNLKLVLTKMADFCFYDIHFYEDQFNGCVLDIVSKICPQVHFNYAPFSNDPKFRFFSKHNFLEVMFECTESKNGILEIVGLENKNKIPILRLPVDFINNIGEFAKKSFAQSPPMYVYDCAIGLWNINGAVSCYLDCKCNESSSVLKPITTQDSYYPDSKEFAQWITFKTDMLSSEIVTKSVEVITKGINKAIHDLLLVH